MKRTEESYIKQSYQTYLNKLNEYSKTRGVRGSQSWKEYSQLYRSLKAEGLSTSRLSSQLAFSNVVFSYTESMNIAKSLSQLTDDSTIKSLGFQVTYNKDGSISKVNLAQEIMTLSPTQAHDLVTSLIDLGIIDDGREFENFTY